MGKWEGECPLRSLGLREALMGIKEPLTVLQWGIRAERYFCSLWEVTQEWGMFSNYWGANSGAGQLTSWKGTRASQGQGLTSPSADIMRAQNKTRPDFKNLGLVLAIETYVTNYFKKQ